MQEYRLTRVDAQQILFATATNYADMIAELVDGRQERGKNAYPITSNPQVMLIVDDQEGGKPEIHEGVEDAWLGVSGTTVFHIGRRGGRLTNQRALQRNGQDVPGEFIGDGIEGQFRTVPVAARGVLFIETNTPHDHRPQEGRTALLVMKVPPARRGRGGR